MRSNTRFVSNKRGPVHFHLLPSGYARGQTCVLAAGVLLNLKSLADEIVKNRPLLLCEEPEVVVDLHCPLWTPYHSLFEAYLEGLRNPGEKIGTTGRAMGPLRGFYDMREALIAGYLLDKRKLVSALEGFRTALSPSFDAMRGAEGQAIEVPEPKAVAHDLLELAHSSGLISKIVDARAYLFDAIINGGKTVLFEGSQATGLSVEAGTWPYVTSTSSIAAGVAVGTLLPPRVLSGSILTMKFFPTRVGGGPMPSELSTRKDIQSFADAHPELFDKKHPGYEQEKARFLAERLALCNSGQATSAQLGEYIMVKAREIGVSTGRGRSPGRPDLAWTAYAIEVSDPVGIALNSLDIASGLDEIEVVVAYRYKGRNLPLGIVPTTDLENVEPIIESWSGWKEDISGITDINKLPEGARVFAARFERVVKRPLLFIGTGPQRSDFIFRRPDGKFATFFG